jgi:hypothetical protein
VPRKKPSADEGICLKDAKGRIRATLSLAPDGTPALQLNDAEGRPRLELMLSPNGDPHIVFWSNKNLNVLSIGLSSRENSCGITMWAPNGKSNLEIGVDADGAFQRATRSSPTT